MLELILDGAAFLPRRPGFDHRSLHVGFVVVKVALRQVSSEYFGFHCQLSFHQMLHTHLSSGAGTIGQLMADVTSGLNLISANLSSHPRPWFGITFGSRV
jgi:hypothetical protein